MKFTNYLSLIFALGLLQSTNALAERPAAFENSADAAPAASYTELQQNDQDSVTSDGRPAANDVTSETRTSGDVLAIPPAAPQTVEAEPELMKKLDFPRRGMKQDKVEEQLGRPIEIIPAVGKPPISRWVYDDRIVYFEYASVIHVVAR
ncbi:MAG: hypothetical protein EP315_04010 [Gammaproteobacteria bacterium]|nr:MAG: hypothetical protein EP315_04010 [Gammaproteobacteria bacterium]